MAKDGNGRRARIGRVLLLALAASFVVTAIIARELKSLTKPLETVAPRRLVSLELARNGDEVARFVRGWEAEAADVAGVTTKRALALAALSTDDHLIYAYTTTLVLAVTLALWWAERRRYLIVIGALAAVAVGLCDHFENVGLREVLAPGANPHGEHLMRWRFFAQMKFILLLAVLTTTLVAAGYALRDQVVQGRHREWWRRFRKTPVVGPPPPPSASPQPAAVQATTAFQRLMQSETDGLFDFGHSGKPDTPVPSDGQSGEPWVEFRAADIVGLALSGGGIRSATFNLGLLQGLYRLRLLPLFDYVSTVSGGGYVGAFWSAWLARRRDLGGEGKSVPEEHLLPNVDSAHPGIEAPQIRHLREFSEFLSARRGFFEAETWQAIVAVLAGLLPAVMSALSVLGLALIVWLVLTFFLACESVFAALVVAGLCTAAALGGLELGWRRRRPADADSDVSARTYWWSSGIALLLVLLAHAGIPRVYARWLGGRWLILDEDWASASVGLGAYDAWWRLVGLDTKAAGFFSPRLYDLALVWLVVGCVFLLARAPLAVVFGPDEGRRVRAPAYDRVIFRLLGGAVLWASVASIWHLAVNWQFFVDRLVVAAGVAGGLFALLRNWIGIALRGRPRSGLLDAVRPYVPQVLAYATVGLAFAGVGATLVRLCGADWMSWWNATAVMLVPIVAVLFFDPVEFGMHGFYRDRITRAYLGAANPLGSADGNRQTDPRNYDDVDLDRLIERPLHLVCCAANDFQGDTLATLSRGARSAVLSRNGIAIGPYAAPSSVTLASAITASAAAFNSSMGSVSMSVGPAVGFLMTALNLRLGLWVPNPRFPDAQPRKLPGLLFYYEMFGATNVDRAAEVHLSDGAHFENLALYELVRRHCRYVIVSDCGEDVEVAFDDFGNVSRKIRDDFGVDLEIDLQPLCPDTKADGPRRSRQHAVVGTIHYTDRDKGILVYVKPTVTGDEPPDIRQYQTRNGRFPHEPTMDQFYDEAQWESYRRLGEHTANVVFGFVQHFAGEITADAMFTTARQEWYPTPPDLKDRVLAMTSRFGALEGDLVSEGKASMLKEVFPELKPLFGVSIDLPGADAQVANLPIILRVTQLMEDIFVVCDLEKLWNHPLNMGWVNLFARWATSRTFRTWWPLLAPLYGPAFVRFMRERFGILDRRLSVEEAKKAIEKTGPDEELDEDSFAWNWWGDRSRPTPERGTKTAYAYQMQFEGVKKPLSLGLALVSISKDAPKASWTTDDFFVPPSLWGGGIGGTFMHALLAKLKDDGIQKFEVDVILTPTQRDDATRADRLGFIEFYKAHHFRLKAVDLADEDARKRWVWTRLVLEV